MFRGTFTALVTYFAMAALTFLPSKISRKTNAAGVTDRRDRHDWRITNAFA
jgi:hypothetical protein